MRLRHLVPWLVGWALASSLSAAAQDFPVTNPPPAPPVSPSAQAPQAGRTPAPAAQARGPVAAALAEPFVGPPERMELVGPPEWLDPSLPQGDAAAGTPVSDFRLLGETVAKGTRKELRWKLGQSFDGESVTTPVIVMHGVKPGPRLCLTAAIHGDELNGVEVVRRVLNEIEPESLSGTVIAVPIVNLLGFSRGSRYLPDRRDLNRYFPGSPVGSAASRIAFSLFKSVIQHCDALTDFHTGSFDRTNLPQVRGDLTISDVLEFTRGFGASPVLHSAGARGMLRLAATDHGIPAVTFEVGAPTRLEPKQINVAVQAMQSLMHRMGMTGSIRMWAEPQATYYESKWVRANQGGMLFSTVELGDRVRQGQRLGKVIDAVNNVEHEVGSPVRGRVIGMALNQLVLPGFAAYHIGIETSEQHAVEEAANAPPDPLEQLEGDEMDRREADPEAEMGPPLLVPGPSEGASEADAAEPPPGD